MKIQLCILAVGLGLFATASQAAIGQNKGRAGIKVYKAQPTETAQAQPRQVNRSAKSAVVDQPAEIKGREGMRVRAESR